MIKFFSLMTILVYFVLQGCFNPIVRGYNFSKNMENESKIKIGMLKDEVLGLMSSPSFQTKEAFYYYSSINKQHPFLHERTLSQIIMIIEFNEKDEVVKINTMKNSKKTG